ncbi:aspartate 1-decarboxylase [Desulfonatronospira sp. MSAO_Bac3]|uniref:aspartate 1-decarboxylase n=1 Tax=Desulfonatronospira sp. MSAO_Bac3 TaxID=2293857 RepID=UPI000FEF30F7|nr:aspartate 1-decarboxylase [Desulfonatronospira sp. MSAO_Bac3]RQD74378.1 MAG: aspartate 1-decarboxylase [Desulfonatronospira sp. MSAO_Bac3]
MPLRTFLQAKIHRATLTGACLDYEGSISVCPELLDISGIIPFEQVDVYNLDNGERLTTYAIRGEPGEIRLNGAAAHKGSPGQKVIIAAYCLLDSREQQEHVPSVVLVDGDNKARGQQHG